VKVFDRVEGLESKVNFVDGTPTQGPATSLGRRPSSVRDQRLVTAEAMSEADVCLDGLGGP